MLRATIISLLALVPVGLAHFTLDFPLTRGFDEDNEPQFCGGFPDAGGRTEFPLGSGPILFGSHHPNAQVAVLVSLEQNPQGFDDFNRTSSGTNLPLLVPFFSVSGEQQFCVDANIQSLNLPGVQNGTNATIQVEYNGGDGNLFQCADVWLSSDFTASNVTCKNGTASASGSSDPAPSSTGSSSSAVSYRFETSTALAVGGTVTVAFASALGMLW